MRTPKKRCIRGHAYEGDNLKWRSDGTYFCWRCHLERQKEYRAIARGEIPPKTRRMNAGVRIVDLLLIDGGWLTLPGIAVALDISEASAAQALYRLRDSGLIEERVVELATRLSIHRQVERRREWRHAQAREAWAS